MKQRKRFGNYHDNEGTYLTKNTTQLIGLHFSGRFLLQIYTLLHTRNALEQMAQIQIP